MTGPRKQKGVAAAPSPGFTAEQTAELQQLIANSIAAAVPQIVAAVAPVSAQTSQDTEEDTADLSEQYAEVADTHAEIEALLAQAIPHMVRARHKGVFDFIRNGRTLHETIGEMISYSVSKALPKYREANGGGGSSSTNAELLSNRLTPQ